MFYKIFFMTVGIFSFAYYLFMVLSFGFAIAFSKFWILLGILSIIILVFIKWLERNKERDRRVLKIMFTICFAFIIGLFVFVEGKIIIEGSRKAQESADYIIVLGAQVIGEKPSSSLQLRINGAAEYMKENENTIAIASGGKGNGENISEAQAIYNGLIEKGISKDRILLENQSENTVQNIKFSKEYIKDGDSVVIVTNRFHVMRACGIAKKLDYNSVSGFGTPSNKVVAINCYVREFFAVLKDKVFGNM